MEDVHYSVYTIHARFGYGAFSQWRYVKVDNFFQSCAVIYVHSLLPDTHSLYVQYPVQEM